MFALALPAATTLLSLSFYLALIATAALAGGSSIAFLSLGHRQMQVLLSFTGGIMLGVGLLHLLPHAYLELDRQIDTTMLWVLVGFFVMFLLERAFHAHSHHAADGSHTGHGCAHDHGGDREATDKNPLQPPAADQLSQAPWAWCGAFAGLALHSLADGAALAASVGADSEHGAGLWAGFATFLAVVLHKPFDSAIIATLMINSGASVRLRRIVNGLYALVVPIGAMAFLASLSLRWENQSMILGTAMALAAGAFLCIAAADLLPEVEFHSHDRILLTASLALGLALAWGIAFMERSSHAHTAHAHGHHADDL
ncbi:MAG: ZIP family metal transporter [Planctomycetia bacterium]|nr:ZIP family metal transporter [Planctomycetia bacterium]